MREEALKGGETTKAKASTITSKLLTRLRRLVTTIAALWDVQDLAKKGAAGLPNLRLMALQPIPRPGSRAGPWGCFSEPRRLRTLEFAFPPSL